MSDTLPTPESEEFNELVKGRSERAIYEVLYQNQGQPLSIAEIRKAIGLESGQQEHLNRRMRELYRIFEVERTRRGTETLYRLIKKLDVQLNTEAINAKVRAWVLRNQKCAQCGRNPTEHGVVLHVDHKLPQAWGGTNDPENLQPLCGDCNDGKKHYYATFDQYTEQIKQSSRYDEPHKRIGELLKAFHGAPVPPDIIEIVANQQQYQDDWKKRLRELRVLGWEIESIRKKEGDRFVAYYALKHHEPWPEGNIRAEITRREVQRKAQNS